MPSSVLLNKIDEFIFSKFLNQSSGGFESGVFDSLKTMQLYGEVLRELQVNPDDQVLKNTSSLLLELIKKIKDGDEDRKLRQYLSGYLIDHADLFDFLQENTRDIVADYRIYGLIDALSYGIPKNDMTERDYLFKIQMLEMRLRGYCTRFGRDFIIEAVESHNRFNAFTKVREFFLSELYPGHSRQRSDREYFMNALFIGFFEQFSWSDVYVRLSGSALVNFLHDVYRLRYPNEEYSAAKMDVITDKNGLSYKDHCNSSMALVLEETRDPDGLNQDLAIKIESEPKETVEIIQSSHVSNEICPAVIERFLDLVRGSYSLWNERKFLEKAGSARGFSKGMHDFLLDVYVCLCDANAIERVEPPGAEKQLTSTQLVNLIRACPSCDTFSDVLFNMLSSWILSLNDAQISKRLQIDLDNLDWATCKRSFELDRPIPSQETQSNEIIGEAGKATGEINAVDLGYQTAKYVSVKLKHKNEPEGASKKRTLVVPSGKRNKNRKHNKNSENDQIEMATVQDIQNQNELVEIVLSESIQADHEVINSVMEQEVDSLVASPEPESARSLSSGWLSSPATVTSSADFTIEGSPQFSSPLSQESMFSRRYAKPFYPGQCCEVRQLKEVISSIRSEIAELRSLSIIEALIPLLNKMEEFFTSLENLLNEFGNSFSNQKNLQKLFSHWNQGLYKIYSNLNVFSVNHNVQFEKLMTLLQTSYFIDLRRLDQPLAIAQKLKTDIQSILPEMQIFYYGKDVMLLQTGQTFHDVDLLICSPSQLSIDEQVESIENKLSACEGIEIVNFMPIGLEKNDVTFYQWKLLVNGVPVDLTFRPDINPQNQRDLMQFSRELKLSVASSVLLVPENGVLFSKVVFLEDAYECVQARKLSLLSTAPSRLADMKPADICYYLRTAISTQSVLKCSSQFNDFMSELGVALQSRNLEATRAMKNFFANHFGKRPYESHLFLLKNHLLEILFPGVSHLFGHLIYSQTAFNMIAYQSGQGYLALLAQQCPGHSIGQNLLGELCRLGAQDVAPSYPIIR